MIFCPNILSTDLWSDNYIPKKIINKTHVFAKHSKLYSNFYETRLKAEKIMEDATILLHLCNIPCSELVHWGAHTHVSSTAQNLFEDEQYGHFEILW